MTKVMMKTLVSALESELKAPVKVEKHTFLGLETRLKFNSPGMVEVYHLDLMSRSQRLISEAWYWKDDKLWEIVQLS